jgi:hypothetical protein
VAAAKQLLADPRHTFYGFEWLWEMGELGRSVEFVADLPWFQPLFTDQELRRRFLRRRAARRGRARRLTPAGPTPFSGW